MDIYKLKFTNLELEIFFYLSIKIGVDLSQRDISKALNVSPTAVSNSLKKLEEENMLNITKRKNINFVSFNRDNKRAIQLKKSLNLSYIYISGLADFLEETLAGSTIVLFGSYSKGEDTIKSDIDLAVIGRNYKNLNLEKFEQKLFRKINLNFYKSWKEIHKHLKNNILNGIVICGSVEL